MSNDARIRLTQAIILAAAIVANVGGGYLSTLI